MRIFSTALLVLTVMVFGCRRDLGEYVQWEVDTLPFIGIESDVSADIFLRQGSFNRVVVEGYENDLDGLNFEVRNGILSIWGSGYFRGSRADIYVTVPDIIYLHGSGSGDLLFEDHFRIYGDIEIRLDGSGDFDLSFEADDILIDMTGSGNLYLQGRARSVEVSQYGSGDLYAFLMRCNSVLIYSNGSGDAEVYPDNYLYARINGSGDVFYRGNPYVEYQISGSGDLYDAN
jgi:hypothetical protein